MSATLATIDPMISSGVMAVGTAAAIMIGLSLVIFSIWTAVDYLVSH
jgi:hypothetical protein